MSQVAHQLLTQAGAMAGFLRGLGASRESCFFALAGPTVDVSAVCHEVRCIDIVLGEKLCVSFAAVGSNDKVASLAPIGEICCLKSLTLDGMVLLRVCVSSEGEPPRARGEVRIPLRSLTTSCGGALYHTWVALENQGFDSIQPAGPVEKACASFEQALLDGTQQLCWPKACLTICGTADLAPSGRHAWTPDASNEFRVARWSSLLRSQQQHVAMCASQHSLSQQAQVGQHDASKQKQKAHELGDQERAQAKEIETLEGRLHGRAEMLQTRRERRRQLDDTWGGKERHTGVREQQQVELENLRAELAQVAGEANSKIESANERIRALRADRDGAIQDVERLSAENQNLLEKVEKLSAEKEQMTEHKEKLMHIVEDLTQTCANAGLPLAGRKSIDSIIHYELS